MKDEEIKRLEAPLECFDAKSSINSLAEQQLSSIQHHSEPEKNDSNGCEETLSQKIEELQDESSLVSSLEEKLKAVSDEKFKKSGVHALEQSNIQDRDRDRERELTDKFRDKFDSDTDTLINTKQIEEALDNEAQFFENSIQNHSEPEKNDSNGCEETLSQKIEELQDESFLVSSLEEKLKAVSDEKFKKSGVHALEQSNIQDRDREPERTDKFRDQFDSATDTLIKTEQIGEALDNEAQFFENENNNHANFLEKTEVYERVSETQSTQYGALERSINVLLATERKKNESLSEQMVTLQADNDNIKEQLIFLLNSRLEDSINMFAARSAEHENHLVHYKSHQRSVDKTIDLFRIKLKEAERDNLSLKVQLERLSGTNSTKHQGKTTHKTPNEVGKEHFQVENERKQKALEQNQQTPQLLSFETPNAQVKKTKSKYTRSVRKTDLRRELNTPPQTKTQKSELQQRQQQKRHEERNQRNQPSETKPKKKVNLEAQKDLQLGTPTGQQPVISVSEYMISTVDLYENDAVQTTLGVAIETSNSPVPSRREPSHHSSEDVTMDIAVETSLPPGHQPAMSLLLGNLEIEASFFSEATKTMNSEQQIVGMIEFAGRVNPTNRSLFYNDDLLR